MICEFSVTLLLSSPLIFRFGTRSVACVCVRAGSQVRLEELGRGAGGVVYKAIHVPTFTVVAVKQIYVEDDSARRQV